MPKNEPFYRPAVTLVLLGIFCWVVFLGAIRWAVNHDNGANNPVIDPCALQVKRGDPPSCR